jgi:hypothetical protein
MKKLFTLLTILLFGLSTLSTAIASSNFLDQEPTKTTKSGKPDKRYNENKHLKKDGTSDMRYKTSKKAAAKKQEVKKSTTTKVKKAA